jgi:hypothetical protein
MYIQSPPTRHTRRVAGLVCGALLVLALGLIGAPAAMADQVVISQEPASITNQTTATFAFSSPAGATAGYECNLDGANSGAFTRCTSPQTLSSLAEGQHTFSVKDPRDDTTPATTYIWTVDLTPPTSDLQGRPDSLTNDSTATFTFVSADSVQPNFQCSLNGGAYAPCVSPMTYTGLGDGTRTFSEEAVDQAGNVQLKANSYTWTTDVTPPDTTILDGPPALSNQTVATFDVAGSDQSYPGDSFICSVDGAPLTVAGCGDGGSVSVGAGKHTFAVAAVDEVGNVDPTPATYAWTVDLTPPKPPILHLGPATSTSPTYVNSSTIEVSWSAGSSDTATVRVFAAEFNHDFKQVSAIGGHDYGGTYKQVGSGLNQSGTAHLGLGDTTCFIAVSTDKVGNTAVTGETSKTSQCVTRVRGIKGFLDSTVSENDTGSGSGWLFPLGHPKVFHYTGFTATSGSDSGDYWDAYGPQPMFLYVGDSYYYSPGHDDDQHLSGVAIVATLCPMCGKIRVSVGEAYWFDGARQDPTPNAPNANDPVWLAPVFSSPWYVKSVTIDLSSSTTDRHVLMPIPQLSVGSISNGKPCSRHDCGKGHVSDFPSYAGFVPNLYLEISALSGKPEIENAAARPDVAFMLSGWQTPTTT